MLKRKTNNKKHLVYIKIARNFAVQFENNNFNHLQALSVWLLCGKREILCLKQTTFQAKNLQLSQRMPTSKLKM